MKTLRLDLDALEVISFAIPSADEAGGGEQAFAPTDFCTRNISCKNTHCC